MHLHYAPPYDVIFSEIGSWPRSTALPAASSTRELAETGSRAALLAQQLNDVCPVGDRDVYACSPQSLLAALKRLAGSRARCRLHRALPRPWAELPAEVAGGVRFARWPRIQTAGA
jgi:hypothetical protein